MKKEIIELELSFYGPSLHREVGHHVSTLINGNICYDIRVLVRSNIKIDTTPSLFEIIHAALDKHEY